MHYAAPVVEGISELSEGVLLGERYQLVRRLDLFSAGAERVAGVEYEYWIALDVTSETEVWVQFAAAGTVYAEGSSLAGAVAALRRINHPAVPVIFAFGEYEFEQAGVVASVGYCAIPASFGETLAEALLREELDQAEILAALAQVAEVLELLAEFELVHGHLSAHSVLLTATEAAGYEVVLVDLPASLALETTLESELSVAADVYALAWLTVLALIGPATLEAEFGSGFAITAELELPAAQVLGQRQEWAAENLVVLGVSETLAAVLVRALGEAGRRPRASVLTAALRAEWMALTTGEVAAEGAAAEELAAVAVVAASGAVAAEEIVAEEVAEAAAEEIVAEEIVAAEVAEAAAEEVAVEEVAELAAEDVVEVEAEAEEVAVEEAETGAGRRVAGAAVAGAVVAGAVVAAEIAGAGSAAAATGALGAGVGAGAAGGVGAAAGGSAAGGTGAAAGGSAGSGAAAANAGAGGAASGTGAAAGGAAAGSEALGLAEAVGVLAVGGAAAGAATETIPKVSGSGGSGAGQAGSGAGAGYAVGSGGGAFGASSSGGSPYSGSGSGSAPWSGEQATRPRPKPAVLVGAGVAAVIVIVLIIVFATGGSGKSNAAAGSVATKTAGASSKPGTGASKGATTGAGAGGSAGASSGATSGSGGSGATSGAGGGGSSGSGTGGSGLQTFPATLATVPASPGQAVQQIQSVVGQASGELTGTEQGQLTQVVNTLSQEVTSGQSISTGMTQFWALLHSGELPSSLNTYLEQYAMYLSASQGS
jgi:hypothetical protein